MKNPRFENLEDVIEDEKGWRRRGDFKSEEDWQNNLNPNPKSATVKRWQEDSKTAAAGRARSAPPPPWHDIQQPGVQTGGGEGSGGSSSGSSGGSSSG